MGLPNRKVVVEGDMSPRPSWNDPEFAQDYPFIHAFMNDAKFEDGTPRMTGSISLFVKFNVLTAAVNDNARGVSAFVNAGTFAELLFLINEGIGSDCLPWRRRNSNGNTQAPPF